MLHVIKRKDDMERLIITFGFEENINNEFDEWADYYDFKVENLTELTTEKIEYVVSDDKSTTFVVMNINEKPYECFTAAAKLSECAHVDVIFVSKQSSPEERLRWSTFGALAVFTEPYKIEELLRFIVALAKKNNYLVRDENFAIDLRNRSFSYKGEEIVAGKKVECLIIYFMQNSNTLITRDEIIAELSDDEHEMSPRNVDTLIKNLRKLTDYNIISTIRGRGYIYNSK